MCTIIFCCQRVFFFVIYLWTLITIGLVCCVFNRKKNIYLHLIISLLKCNFKMLKKWMSKDWPEKNIWKQHFPLWTSHSVDLTRVKDMSGSTQADTTERIQKPKEGWASPWRIFLSHSETVLLNKLFPPCYCKIQN